MKRQTPDIRQVRCPEEVLVKGRWKIRKGENTRVIIDGRGYDHMDDDWWFDIQTGEAVTSAILGLRQTKAK